MNLQPAKWCVILLGMALTAGCLTQRRAVRQLANIQAKHPALFSPDTVIVDSTHWVTLHLIDTLVLGGSKYDTAVVTSLVEVLEKLPLENERMKIELRTTANMETNKRTWELSGEVKADTILRVVERPVKYVVYKTMPAAPCQVVGGLPWWVGVIIGVVGVFISKRFLKSRIKTP